jgi:hypothetical protein
MKIVKKLEDWMAEDTSGGGGFTGTVVGLANSAGMGNVVSSQPSSIPGDAAGATWGSGDIGSGWSQAKKLNKKKTDSDLFGSAKRRAGKLLRGFKDAKKDGLFQMNTPKKGKGNIKSFSDFKKK